MILGEYVCIVVKYKHGHVVKRKHGCLQNSYCAGSIPARASYTGAVLHHKKGDQSVIGATFQSIMFHAYKKNPGSKITRAIKKRFDVKNFSKVMRAIGSIGRE